ncbi:MAG: hypothetical protein ACR2JF_06090 [Iamia sp.]
MTDSDDDQILDRLGQALSGPVPPIDHVRVRRVSAQATEATVPALSGPSQPSRRRVLWMGAAAAGGVAAGVTGAALLADGDDGPITPAGEAVGDLTTPFGVEAEARVIAHEWGLEVMLDVSGLEPGTPYTMTFIDQADQPLSAGGFVGAEGLMRCRNNGPVLRADVARFEVTDPGGVVVVKADLT